LNFVIPDRRKVSILVQQLLTFAKVKVIATILAILFFNLAVFPCSDENIDSDVTVELRMLTEDGNHADDIDLCSPFCFCQCCHMQSEYLTYFTIEFIHPLSIKMPDAATSDVVGYIPSRWQPPQV